MTTQFAKAKKFARLAVMAAAVTTIGLGLGAGTAQATPKHPDPRPHPTMGAPLSTFNQRVDNFSDRVQARFGVGEGTPFDNRTDALFGVK
jgi:hypothetical protein